MSRKRTTKKITIKVQSGVPLGDCEVWVAGPIFEIEVPEELVENAKKVHAKDAFGMNPVLVILLREPHEPRWDQ